MRSEKLHFALQACEEGGVDFDDVAALLMATDEDGGAIRAGAEEVLLRYCGSKVRFRGLVEFSNVCRCDCFYCGIRAGNREVQRYTLGREEIVEAALWCAEQGYGSVVLQSGERRDEEFIRLTESCVREIKERSRSARLPRGVGITLCVGEQTRETYARFFAAGAHRYLLRIETTSPELFAKIHPPRQSLESRIQCLRDLRETGFQVGTGVMIGLPGQTAADLARDILFFREMDMDMIGMGPFIAHRQTPLGKQIKDDPEGKRRILDLSLRMIAVTRLVLRDVNIAATTALQAMHPLGREMGLRHGANVIMPQATPVRVRRNYQPYEGKPCMDESVTQCRGCLVERIKGLGRELSADDWGDSAHAICRINRKI
ncbi:MAG: [FeFe] hydrogenase H-cluster radical SAM maturase HydE [Verrucomicrobiae bacterium]|nr:[FeFe] hydrogenase H-cluster radical SAM maturase HydE [Verrucomicrobiae bacterium]